MAVLPSAPSAYSQRDQTELRAQVETMDKQNWKRGRDINLADTRLILTSPNGTRYILTVDNSGALGTTAA